MRIFAWRQVTADAYRLIISRQGLYRRLSPIRNIGGAAFLLMYRYKFSSHFLPDLVFVQINKPPTTIIPTVNINPKASISQVFKPFLAWL